MTLNQFNAYLSGLTTEHPEWHYCLDIRNRDQLVLVRIMTHDDFELAVITMEAFMEEYYGKLELTVNYLYHYDDTTLGTEEQRIIDDFVKDLKNDSH